MSSSSLLEKNAVKDIELSIESSSSKESLEYLDINTFHKKRNLCQVLFSSKCLWAIHLAFILFNVAFFVLVGQSIESCINCNVDGVLPYNDAPIEMVRGNIAPGGVHNDPTSAYNEYEGRPNVTNNAAWARLMEGKCSIEHSRALTYLTIAGFMDMADDEYERMGLESALNVQGTGKHIVSISVFHQLHCVVSMLSQTCLLLC
jgi:Mycotoxin biosynthesis protein UstYa